MGNGSDDKLLQEIRNRGKLPHEQSCPSAYQDRGLPSRCRRHGQSARKNYSRQKPRNPLKRLEFEREESKKIQENPRPPSGAFAAKTPTRQENPNRPHKRPVRAPEGGRTLRPKRKAD